MTRQEIDTEKVASASNKLKAVNSTINTEFSALQNKAKQLDNNWDSAAGDTAKTMFYQLFKNAEARSTVLENYANILEHLINPSYSYAETTNTKLADQFK